MNGQQKIKKKVCIVICWFGCPGGGEIFPTLYKSVRRQKYTVGAETAPKPEQTREQIPFPSTFFFNAYIMECQAVGMTVVNEYQINWP